MEINKLSYEEAIAKLEELLIDLENESCTLRDSLNKFKEGMDLYNHCSDILKKAEGEVKVLLGDDKDTLVELDFVKEAEDEYY